MLRCSNCTPRSRSRSERQRPDADNESFPSFLDEDSDSGNDSLPQAFEF
jgi:hypothetical protein